MIARGETRSQIAMKSATPEEQAQAEAVARRAVATLEEGRARAAQDAARGRLA
jgi:hypothetical protein